MTAPFEEYVCSDNDIQCVPMLDTADIVLLWWIQRIPAVTYKDACLAFQTLKSFFLHSSERSNIEAPFNLLLRLGDQLMRYHNTSISCTQGMIMD